MLTKRHYRNEFLSILFCEVEWLQKDLLWKAISNAIISEIFQELFEFLLTSHSTESKA